MKTPDFTRQFKKDLTRIQYSGKKIEKLKNIISLLVEEKPLDLLRRDHKLRGQFQGSRECHIESNWLLIYTIEGNRIIFERTGSHSELFE